MYLEHDMGRFRPGSLEQFLSPHQSGLLSAFYVKHNEAYVAKPLGGNIRRNGDCRYDFAGLVSSGNGNGGSEGRLTHELQSCVAVPQATVPHNHIGESIELNIAPQASMGGAHRFESMDGTGLLLHR